MAKKNFDNIDTGNIYADQIAEATAAPAAPELPGQKQGRANRHNMAFTPENYEFIRCMARVRGQTITGFVNDLIAKAMEDNAETYQAALQFRDSL